MENCCELFRQSVELCETMLEGLGHVLKRLDEGALDDTRNLLSDMIDGFLSVERALQAVTAELPENNIARLGENVEVNFERLVESYKNNDVNDAVIVMKQNVIPGFIQWKKELEVVYSSLKN